MKQHTNGINQHLPFNQQAACGIGERGATSMGDALKSNATLTELELNGEDKKTTQKRHPSTNHSFPFSSNQQTSLETQEQHH